MDKVLRPSRLDTDPSSQDTSSDWLHRKKKKNFWELCSYLAKWRTRKNVVLTNFVTSKIYQYIEDITEYDLAIEVLEKLLLNLRTKSMLPIHLRPESTPVGAYQGVNASSQNLEQRWQLSTGATSERIY